MSKVLLNSECCSLAMFEKKILREQTATTAEPITKLNVSLMLNRSKKLFTCFYFTFQLNVLLTCRGE